MPRALDLLPHQVRRQRATFTQCFARAVEQRVGMLAQCTEGPPRTAHIAHVQPSVDLRAPRQPLCVGLLVVRLLGQGLEQAVELHRGLFLPIQLQ